MRSWRVLVLVPAIAHGDDLRVAPCRPTVTCTADLAAPGTLELELGYQLRSGITQTTPFLIKLPVARWAEVQVGDDSVVDNPAVGVKLHVIDQTSYVPSVAFTVAASIPTSELIATAHASKDLGRYHVDANAGVAAWQGVRQPFAAVAVTRALTDRWSATLEPHYYAYAEPYAQRDGGAIAAAEYSPRPWLVIDAAIDATVIGPHAVAGLAGISIAPARLWGGH
jgi:hypothetical protein